MFEEMNNVLSRSAAYAGGHIECCAELEGKDIDLRAAVEQLPSIGMLVKQGRQRNGLTQTALASAAGMTPAEISRIEGGITKKPSRKVLQVISPYVGIPYTQLLFYAGYSGVIDEEIYYNKKNEKIPYMDIVDDIYKADPELLEVLQGVQQLPMEDIEIIKNLIGIMKESSSGGFGKESMKLVKKMFDATKLFLAEQLSGIIRLFKVYSQDL